jgi:phage-related baseplate assembly protein
MLDELGSFHNTPRLQAKKATTVLKWSLSTAQPKSIMIAKGKRASPDGVLYFITSEDLVIPSGQMSGTVIAEALEAGAEYNNFAPGQIKIIVDPIPYVTSVENTTESDGGADTEDDDSYRERIRLAPESYSVAGPEGAYIYWAKTADANIEDVSVTSPTPGAVKITVLMKDRDAPSQETLDKVLAAASDKNVRPLTDNVTASGATDVPYDINLTYFISKVRKENEASICAAVESIGGIIDQYKNWQSGKLGRAINPDYLRQLIFNVGVFRVDLTSPVYTDVNLDQVAKAGVVTAVYGGLI